MNQKPRGRRAGGRRTPATSPCRCPACSACTAAGARPPAFKRGGDQWLARCGAARAALMRLTIQRRSFCGRASLADWCVAAALRGSLADCVHALAFLGFPSFYFFFWTGGRQKRRQALPSPYDTRACRTDDWRAGWLVGTIASRSEISPLVKSPRQDTVLPPVARKVFSGSIDRSPFCIACHRQGQGKSRGQPASQRHCVQRGLRLYAVHTPARPPLGEGGPPARGH